MGCCGRGCRLAGGGRGGGSFDERRASGEEAEVRVPLVREHRSGGIVVLYLFSCHDWIMNDDLKPVSKQDPGFDMEQGLRKARPLWPSRRAHGQDNPFGPVANAVVEHLAHCGIRFFRIAPRRGHGTPVFPYRRAQGGNDPGSPAK